METIISMLETTGVFIVGLLARGGIVLAVIGVLSLPIMLAAVAMRAAEELKRRQLGLRDVAGLLFRPDLWYAPNHTWMARRHGGTLVVGLDDLALRLLPAVTRVEVPRPGTHVAKGEPIATLFAGGRMLATAIDARRTSSPQDFRPVYDAAQVTPFALPAEVARALARYLEAARLRYAAVDLRLDEDGRLFFLEANSSGQWLFLEDRTGQPITAAVAQALSDSAREVTAAAPVRQPAWQGTSAGRRTA